MQLLFAVAGLGLGLLLPRITAEPTVASSRVTETLVGVGFGVLGLVSIIFSLLFLVVQWAFSSLSPRLNLFRDDPIVWRTFGLAVGVFVFSVTAALVIGNDPQVSVIVPVAEVVAVLSALAMIRALQVKAFASIQLAPTLSAIGAQGRAILDDLYPRPGPDRRPPPRRCRHCAGPSPGRTGRPSCYVDGALVGNAEAPVTTPFAFNPGALTCGANPGSAITDDYASPFTFTGTIHSVTVDVSGKLIEDSEAELRVHMARQ